jgi:hypothetical protein
MRDYRQAPPTASSGQRIFSPFGAFGRRAWFTVTPCPATITVEVRAASVVFSATVTLTVPLLVPVPGVTPTQSALLAADHPQAADAMTVTLDVLGSEPTVSEVGDTV